jgi:arabinose-5-phosphate isomerase
VNKEACPLGLAPTTSTTATLLMGDALLVCLMEKRKFQPKDFSVYHPGGALGRKLMGIVKHFMSTSVPQVMVDTPFRELVCEMSDKHLGMTMVYNDEECVGIITDGDVRRAIEKYNDVHVVARDIMTPSYKVIAQDALLTDALAVMDKYNITTLAVTDSIDSKEIIGVISIHHIIDFK